VSSVTPKDAPTEPKSRLTADAMPRSSSGAAFEAALEIDGVQSP